MTTAPGWLTERLLVLGLVTVLLSCLVLAGIIVGTKGARLRGARRRARHLAPYRAALLEVASGEPEPESLRLVAGVPAASRPTVHDFVLDLLGKVKGEPAQALAGLLAEHGALERARREVTSRRPVVRGRAALMLGRCGDRDSLPQLVHLLGDRDALVRQAAATALGPLGDPVAAPALLAAVDPRHGHGGIPSGVATDALLSLGYEAQAALPQALRHADPGVRAVAADVVAGSHAFSARPHVRHALQAETNPAVLEQLCRALGEVGDARDVDLLARVAGSGQPGNRHAAALALGRLGDAASVPALAHLLRRPDPALAATAARSLASMDLPAARPALEAARGEGSAAATGELAVLSLRERREVLGA